MTGAGGPVAAPAQPPSASDRVGIIMSKSVVGDAVAAEMRRQQGVAVLDQPTFWEIKAAGRLRISFEEVGQELGYEVRSYHLQVEMSTHYGRLVSTDTELMLFADPIEALEHLSA